MYKIIYTVGNTETVVAEYESLEKAREEAEKLSKTPEYCRGLLTVEEWKDKSRRIY